MVTELQNALACAGRVFELIDEPAADARTRRMRRRSTIPTAQWRIEDVHFSYTPDRHADRRLQRCRVQPGQRVAIVGPTGCGKTTMINLLMRFYDVDGGEIHVDGHETRRPDAPRVCAKNIGMVLQDTWLNAGTIRENIAMGKPDATEEEIIAAAKASHAHSFIKRLPDGYDTVISESRRPALAGTEAAALYCARDAVPAADADSGRGDLLHRHANRAKDSGSLCADDAGPHELHRCAPPIHHPRART